MKRYQVIGICIAIGFVAGYYSAIPTEQTAGTPVQKPLTKAEERKKIRAEKAAQEAAQEAARLEAMTSEERAAEAAEKKFDSDRFAYGMALTQQIKKAAFDEKALQLKRPKYYSNGVCVEANGKNRFGAYVGWQKHCYLYKDSIWAYRAPN